MRAVNLSLRFVALLGALLRVPLSAATPPAWERLAPLPVGNGGFVGAALGGEIIVAGGTTWQGDTKRWLAQIWAYSPARNTWREAGRLPAPLAYAVSTQVGETLWFAGGSSRETTHRTLWTMDASRTPQLVSRLERGFVYAAGARVGLTLYAVGGTDDQGRLDRITNQFLAIDLKSGAITRLADYPEASLTTATAAASGGEIFVFGGARWDAAKGTVVNHTTAHAYAVGEQRWSSLPALPHPGRGYTAVTLDDRHIFLAGGYRSDVVEFTADAYIFDRERKTYTPTTALPYAGMVGLVTDGPWLYCLGGEDRKKHRTDAVYRIRWASLLPAPR
ncbi:MAG: hypothetical protein FJ381_09170 [Verrucomicrobia bacterium]|nr:hypothetical protein [Verrucomicrobiota bacterium]